jgi:ABC-type amino acid transport substrate-binding protein
MRYRVVLGLALWLGCLGSTLIAATGLISPDIEAIRKRGVLRVEQFDGERLGFFMVTEPQDAKVDKAYSLKNGRRLVGYDINLAHDIARQLGVRLEFSRTAKTFNEVCRRVASGEADLGISKLTMTSARSQYLSWSIPYMRVPMGVMINRLVEAKRRNGSDLQAFLNNPKTTVAVQGGAAFVSFAKRMFPKATLIECDGFDKTLDAVLNGKASVMLDDELNMSLCLRRRPEIALHARMEILPAKFDAYVSIGVAPQNPHLLHFVNTLLRTEGWRIGADDFMEKYYPAVGSGNTELTHGQEPPSQKTPEEIIEKSPEVKAYRQNVAFVVIVVLFGILWGCLAWRQYRHPVAVKEVSDAE